ncbi:MAG: cytochrome C [Deltaproteobacteria bacterium]|nr:cytochrome C [Deltaproteobacteria bacterium]
MTVSLLAATGTDGGAPSFHDGGVGACDGCHLAHRTRALPQTKGGITDDGNRYLLSRSDASSTCLACHAGDAPGAIRILQTRVAAGAGPMNLTPGGDFAWLVKSFTWHDSRGRHESPGHRHGHNVVAADYGLVADSRLAVAPGGAFPAAALTCVSCHDPHGRARLLDDRTVLGSRPSPHPDRPMIRAPGSYGAQPTAAGPVGVYRLLGAIGYRAAGAPATSAFTAPPPTAVSPAQFNRSERTTDTRVAYGQGMSEWCANCHGAIHNDARGTLLVHPASNASALAPAVAAYNMYDSGESYTGAREKAYTSMVPYEEGTGSRSALAALAVSDGSKRAGPDGDENVMCLSCHRAHASGWDGALRWNNAAALLVVDGEWPGTDAFGREAASAGLAQGRSVAETQAAMYDRLPGTYARRQRSLCNKCHAED